MHFVSSKVGTWIEAGVALTAGSGVALTVGNGVGLAVGIGVALIIISAFDVGDGVDARRFAVLHPEFIHNKLMASINPIMRFSIFPPIIPLSLLQ